MRAQDIHGTTVTSDQRRRILAITTIFENDTPEQQYSYIEDLHDGRGYTAGIVGFCTGTGDLLLVVERYTQLQPKNVLERYLPALRELDRNHSASTSGLPDFTVAWAEAAKDPLFRQAQDDLLDRLYFGAALNAATRLGLQNAVSVGFFYDTLVQHGDGMDPDGFRALVERTRTQVGGLPRDGLDEKAWLLAFMNVRHRDLEQSFDAATREVWSKSAWRVDVYRDILASGNADLKGPLTITVNPHEIFVLP